MAKTDLTPRELFAHHEAHLLEVLYGEGGAAVNAEDKKRLERYAFSSVTQPAGPFKAQTGVELEALVSFKLAANDREQRAKLVGATSEADATEHLLEVRFQAALNTAKSLHSHYMKYIDSSLGGQHLTPPGSESSPFLTSRSAKGMRYLTANLGRKEFTAASRLYLTAVEWDGELTTIANLVSEDNPYVRSAFMQSGTLSAHYDEIVTAFQLAFSTHNEEPPCPRSLQLRWPVLNEGAPADVALTPLPALSVYNALTAMHDYSWDLYNQPEKPSYALRMRAFAVGGHEAA